MAKRKLLSQPRSHYSDISVIYNPKSTGSGFTMAKELKRELEESMPNLDVHLVATKYPGHAEKLAYKLAKSTPKPLIISASGDGGYHEVINGLVKAQKEGASPTAGLLPAGNANDHFHDVHQGDLASSIKFANARTIDLLKLTTTVNKKQFKRYAHSYIGLGLTPKVGHELNKTELNWLNEKWIVLKSLFLLQPVKIIINGKRRSYYSIVFSNVSKMSKVLTLSKESDNNDGKFEVTIFRHRNKSRLLMILLRASTSGLAGDNHVSRYTFQTLKPLLVQMDGEISKVDANTEATVSIDRRILSCII